MAHGSKDAEGRLLGPSAATQDRHLSMCGRSTLVYGSIENYVWGVRVWMQSQMVVDPLMGVLFWAGI